LDCIISGFETRGAYRTRSGTEATSNKEDGYDKIQPEGKI